jgi:DNA adenine methylase
MLKIRQDLSPLRYPGGKRRLLPLIADLLEQSGRQIELLVEPFIGGGAITIGLLESDMVQRAAIADKDPLVASFWSVVFSEDAEALAHRVADAPLTVEEWLRLRQMDPENRLDAAYKCIFLNRTSFSGLLTKRCGPIGGHLQTGSYLIDCRFNRDRISARIAALSMLKSRIEFVRCQTWERTLEQTGVYDGHPGDGRMVYLDPPFFAKANDLYRHHFDDLDHAEFALAVDRLGSDFVLSYDDHPDALRIYGDHAGFRRVALNYCARINSDRPSNSEAIISPLFAELSPHRRSSVDEHFLPLPQSRKQRIKGSDGNQAIRFA